MGQLARAITEAVAQHGRAAKLLQQLEEQNNRDAYHARMRREEQKTEDRIACDSALEPWSRTAPAPKSGETRADYRRRLCALAAGFLPPDHRLKDVGIERCDADVVDIFFPEILAATKDAVRCVDTVPYGSLREVVRHDSSGRKITDFVGAESFVKSMGRENRRVTQFCRRDGTLRDL
jgi:hypothetical protein